MKEAVCEAFEKPCRNHDLRRAVFEPLRGLCERCLCAGSAAWEMVRACLTPGPSERTGFF